MGLANYTTFKSQKHQKPAMFKFCHRHFVAVKDTKNQNLPFKLKLKSVKNGLLRRKNCFLVSSDEVWAKNRMCYGFFLVFLLFS
jgi:hypothetical protein